MNPYETTALLSQYLLFHFGEPAEVLPYRDGPVSGLDYAARYVRECVDRRILPAHARALDLGCSVGGTAFELARYSEKVIGIDFSRRFIAAARALQRRGQVRYERVEAGILTTTRTARVPPSIDRSRVAFEVGDAMALRKDIGTFDVVLMANLLDRLRDPMRCLRQLPDLVTPGGQLVISSPYTWLAEYTPRSKWLGGVKRRGRTVRTHDSLMRALRTDFELARRIDVPFTIRDHARKFQWAVADATIWIRRGAAGA